MRVFKAQLSLLAILALRRVSAQGKQFYAETPWAHPPTSSPPLNAATNFVGGPAGVTRIKCKHPISRFYSVER